MQSPARGGGIQLSAPLRGQVWPLWGGMGWGGCWGSGLTRRLPRPPEPGYYRDGEFGIRIEDVALVVEAQTKVGPGWQGWHDTGGLLQAGAGGAPNATSL